MNNNNRVPTVYIVEPAGITLDVSALYDHGDVAYVYAPEDSRPSIWRPEYVEDVIKRMLKMGYDPTYDYFAVVGRMVPVVMVATSLAARWPEAKMLYFSSTEREYVERPAVIAGTSNIMSHRG